MSCPYAFHVLSLTHLALVSPPRKNQIDPSTQMPFPTSYAFGCFPAAGAEKAPAKAANSWAVSPPDIGTP